MSNFPENFNQRSNSQESRRDTPGVLGSIWLFVWDFVKIFIIALAIIVPIRFYLFQPFIVTGQSMLPNFEDGQYLIIDEISYRFSEPMRGQVAVIHSPQDNGQFFIKRIIGLPGETIEIKDSQVIVTNQENPRGFVLREEYLADNIDTFGNIRVVLSDSQYFVLGDNRVASSDSRVFGPIAGDSIVGKVFIRAFPLDKFDKFGTPIY